MPFNFCAEAGDCCAYARLGPSARLETKAVAVDAAGVIHSDFAKKFIMAEVMGWREFVKVGGWKRGREKGLVRSEGRDYVVGDGEVVEFKVGG